MPLYEWKCDKCKKVVEKLVFGKDMDAPPPKCSKCKKPMHRILSEFSFDIHGYSYANEYTKKAEE